VWPWSRKATIPKTNSIRSGLICNQATALMVLEARRRILLYVALKAAAARKCIEDYWHIAAAWYTRFTRRINRVPPGTAVLTPFCVDLLVVQPQSCPSILTWLRRFINHLLTYLLSYLKYIWQEKLLDLHNRELINKTSRLTEASFIVRMLYKYIH